MLNPDLPVKQHYDTLFGMAKCQFGYDCALYSRRLALEILYVSYTRSYQAYMRLRDSVSALDRKDAPAAQVQAMARLSLYWREIGKDCR